MNITVKSGSSFWKVVTMWGSDDLPNNFCSLFWCITWKSFLIIVACICSGAYLGFLLATFAASFKVGFIIWSAPLVITLLIFAFFSAVVILVVSKDKYDEQVVDNPRGVLANSVNAYRSWKGKFCPRVTLINKQF